MGPRFRRRDDKTRMKRNAVYPRALPDGVQLQDRDDVLRMPAPRETRLERKRSARSKKIPLNPPFAEGEVWMVSSFSKSEFECSLLCKETVSQFRFCHSVQAKRDRSSSLFNAPWIPAFAGMTGLRRVFVLRHSLLATEGVYDLSPLQEGGSRGIFSDEYEFFIRRQSNSRYNPGRSAVAVSAIEAGQQNSPV